MAEQSPESAPASPSDQRTDISRLNAERTKLAKDIGVLESIMNAPSFAERARLYCRYQTDNFQFFVVPGVHSGDELEAFYQALLRAQPPTREEEFTRQQQLNAVREMLLSYRRNIEDCERGAVTGFQTIPTNEQLQQRIAGFRQALAAIEKGAALGDKTFANSQPTQAITTSPPVVLKRVEPEYSEEARRAKFNGVIRVSITIDTNGKVIDVRFLSAQLYGLQANIIQALQQWRLKPALKDGVPIRATAVVEFTFQRF